MAGNSRELRGRAKAACRGARTPLALAAVAVALPSCLPLLWDLRGTPGLQWLVSIAAAVLLYPAASLGMAHMSLRAWQGGPTEVGDVLYFVKQRDLLPRAWLLGAMQILLLQLGALPGTLTGVFRDIPALMLICALLDLAAKPVLLWLTLRLALVTFAFCREPEKGTLSLFRDSFRRMRGHVWAFLKLMLRTAWWRGLLSVGLWTILMTAVPRRVALAAFAALLLWAVLSPYPNLAAAAFADSLLPTERELRRERQRDRREKSRA